MIPGRKFPKSLEETVVQEGNVQNDVKQEAKDQPFRGWNGWVFPADRGDDALPHVRISSSTLRLWSLKL